MTLPGGGETVGEAYIRILADGSGLDRSIRSEFERDNPEFERAGRDQRKSYQKGWDAEGKGKKTPTQSMLRDIIRSKGEWERVGADLGGDFGRKIRQQMEREFGKDTADRLFRDFSTRFQASGKRDFAKGYFSNLGPALARVLAQQSKDLAKQRSDEEREARNLAQYMTNLRRKSVADAIAAARKQSEEVRKIMERQAKDIERGLRERQKKDERDQEKAFRDATKRLTRLVQLRYTSLGKLDKDFANRDRDTIRRTFDDVIAKMRAGDDKAFKDLERRSSRIVHLVDQGLGRISKDAEDGVAEMGKLEAKVHKISRFLGSHDLGKYFGQGNRNNFINSFGNLIGIVVRGIGVATVGLTEHILRVGSAFKVAWKDGDTFKQKLLNITDLIRKKVITAFSNLGKVIGVGALGLVGAIGAGMGALGLLQTLIGPLIAGIDGLVGGITALVSSLAYGLVGGVVALSSAIGIGLVGAIGAAMPLLGAVIITAGLAAAAFSNLSKQQKKALKQKIKPLIDEWHSAQKAFQGGLFSNLDQQVGLFRKALHDLHPLFHDLGASLSGIATQLAKSFQLPGWQKNIQSLTDFIPKSIRRLGDVFIKVFRGIGGVMRALAPISMRLLHSLTDSARTFANWSNSVRGQSDLRKFFSEAWHTAQLLGHALAGVAKILGDVLGAGRKAGNTLLTSLGGALDKLHTYFQSDKGSKALASFISEAFKSAKLLWGALEAIGKTLGDILAAGKGLGDYFLKSIGGTFDKLDKFFKSTKGQQALKGFFATTKTFMGYFMQALAGIGKLWVALDNAQTRHIINGIMDTIGSVLTWISRQVPFIQDLISKIEPYIARIVGSIEHLVQAAEPLISKIAHTIGTVLVGAFRLLGPMIANAVQWLADAVKYISDHWDTFKYLAGAIAAVWAAFKGFSIINNAIGSLQRFVGMWTDRWSQFTTRIGNMSRTARIAVAGLFAAMAGGAVGGMIGANVGGTGGKVLGALGGAGAGALAGSVFGPEGTAIGALVGGISGLVSAWHEQGNAASDSMTKAKLATERAKQSVNDLTQALQETNGAYNKIVKSQVIQQLEKAGLLSIGEKAQINLADITKAALGSYSAFRDVENAASRAVRAGLITGAQKTALLNGLEVQQTALGKAEGAYQRTREAAGKLVEANSKVAKSFQHVVDRARKLGLGKFSKGGVAGIYDPRIPGKSDPGADARRTTGLLKSQLAMLGRIATKQINNGRDANKVATAYSNQVEKLKKAYLQAGYNKKIVSDLFASYAALPKAVYTRVVAKDEATILVQKVEGLVGKLAKPREVRIIAKLENMKAAERLKWLLDHMKKFRDIYLRIHDPYLTAVHAKNGGTAFFASGGLATTATRAMVGEAGPEAVVPLDRPLSQVDPSVRALSAIAQGMPHLARGGVVNNQHGPQKQVNINQGAITVVTPTTDPGAVAMELLGRVAAGGYV